MVEAEVGTQNYLNISTVTPLALDLGVYALKVLYDVDKLVETVNLSTKLVFTTIVRVTRGNKREG